MSAYSIQDLFFVASLFFVFVMGVKQGFRP